MGHERPRIERLLPSIIDERFGECGTVDWLFTGIVDVWGTQASHVGVGSNMAKFSELDPSAPAPYKANMGRITTSSRNEKCKGF